MTTYQQFFIDKTVQPFADALILHGFASLLEKLAPDRVVTLHDQGTNFTITLDAPISDEVLEQAQSIELIPFVKTVKNAGEIADKLIYQIDYEERKRAVDEGFAMQPPRPPEPEWSIYRAINPGALPGYNTLVSQWHTAHDPETLRILFDLFSECPNNLDRAVSAWAALDKSRGWGIKPTITCLQLFNPDQGKGQNRSKADGLSIGNVDDFWLLEYLKAAGFYEGAITRTMRGSKDRKTIVVVPRHLTASERRAVKGEFAASMQLPLYPIQFDILAVIRYMTALIKLTLEPEFQYIPRSGRSRIKHDLVAGFHTAFYKDLGNAVATMNLSFLGLPGWVVIESHEDVARFTNTETGLLPEFEKFVRQFDEHESDVPELLRPLRDFVSGDDLSAFFRFTSAFPVYLIGRTERNKYARPLTTSFIERIIMSQTDRRYSEILASPGFRNIAYAIRQSTVTAQYRKKQGDRKYDVRYGLGQELARKARYAGEFVTALSDFLHKYNAENAQVMELRPAPYRKSIHTSDIEQIVALIDEYGSETVANLLIAYGYARMPREDSGDDSDQSDDNSAYQGE